MDKFCSSFVLLISAGALYGWWQDVPFLISVIDGKVTMKPITAINFIFCGGVVWSWREHKTLSRFEEWLLSASTEMLLISGLYTAFSHLLDVEVFLKNLIPFAAEDTAIYSLRPGEPSFATTASFLITAVCGFVSFFYWEYRYKLIRFFGVLLSLVGGLGIVGYAIDDPRLYYYFPGYSGAMAIHTALNFLLIGLAFFHNKTKAGEYETFNKICKLFRNRSSTKRLRR